MTSDHEGGQPPEDRDDHPTQTRHERAPVDPDIPSRIGQYTIKRRIASGGMGTVYEALQENPRRTVAIKVMKRGASSESALRRFEYESQLLARLRHPAIAQVYEAGTHDDAGTPVPFFAMEYIPNAKTLTEYADSRKLGTRERLELFVKVCEGVHHGHQKGIVHRDLKPANILVDSQGQPRIIDFGVARATDSDMARATVQTSVGQLVGSLQYMSPEQIEADPHDIDTRSDIYSLGVVLWEMLTSSLPYDVTGTPIHEAARIVREQGPPRANDAHPKLKGDLETIARKTMEKDRDRRYQSAFGLAQDISRYLDGEAILARPPSLTYQLRVFARRHRTLIGAVAAVFVILAVAVVVSTSLYFDARAQRRLAESQIQKTDAAVDFVREMLYSAVPHGYGSQTTVTDLLDRSSEKTDGAFPEDPEVEAEVRHLLGMGYMNLEGYDKSKRELEAALELYRGSLGGDHDATREVLEDLAFLYLVVGREVDREEALRAIVGIRSRTQGEEHPETLAAMASLADNLISQGKLGDGEELTSRTYAAQRRVFGQTHDDTLGTRSLQGRIHFARGEMAEAEQISREVLEGYRDLKGSEHASTRLATGDLASTLLAQGKVEEARQLYENRAVPDPLGVEMWFQGGESDGAAGDRAVTQMLVFWETWCPFSQRVVPELERVHQRFQDQDFELVGMTAVRRSATDEKVREFIAAKEITYPIGKEDGRASDVLAVRGTPWVSLVSDGALVWEGYLQTPEEMSGKMIDGLMRARED